MKCDKIIAVFLICLCFSSCSDREKYVDIIEAKAREINDYKARLKKQESVISQVRDSVSMLVAEINKFKKDPILLKNQAEEAYKNQETAKVGEILTELLQYHAQSKEIKQVEMLHNTLLKKEEAERKAEQRRLAAEELKNPHTAKGLAKKAAKGGWVVGIWQKEDDLYATIVYRYGAYYLYELTPSASSIGGEMKLKQVEKGKYRAYDEKEDDRIYVVTEEGLETYRYDTRTAMWKKGE